MNHPWPKKGIKAFVEGEGAHAFYRTAALWNHDYHAEAFKKGAEMLLDAHLEKTPFPFHDEIFFPIAYLYRHCLELRLKDIVSIGDSMGLFKPGEVSDALKGHSLARLWTYAKKAITERWPEGDKATLAAVEAVINEFHQVDPTGQAFRYERDINGKPHFLKNLPSMIDPQHLRNAVNATYSFLDSTGSGLYDTFIGMLDQQEIID
jgi:hypothetical protein